MNNYARGAGIVCKQTPCQDTARGQDPGDAADLEQLRRYWTGFLQDSGRVAQATARAYGADLEQFCAFLASRGHSMNPGDVRPSDIAGFRDSNAGWRPTTVRRKLAAVSRFLDWAVEHGIVASNPAASIRAPSGGSPPTSFVTLQDALALLLECRTDRERAIIATLWFAGLRHGELRRFRLRDLDLANDEMTILGKGNHRASIPIVASLKPYLLRWLEQRPDVDHDFVFTTRTGRPLYVKAVPRLVRRLAKHCGLEHKSYCVHAFRHGCATSMAESGVSLPTVARYLRHTDLSSVGRYVHCSTRRVRDEIEEKMGRHDAESLSALNAAHTEAIIERIAERVAQKLLQHQAGHDTTNEEGTR